ncbi:MAG: isopentenyl-diphosphate Delta-isomerase [Caldithrix sp.]|nr:isopentenyl-diphosphate Delta-isomerase [Caldithrix sp.]
MEQDDNIVSFDDELLILVDEQDNELGWETKEKCHNGKGILHRAFSIFIFNEKNELLLQKRSGSKRLWPLFWSNTCCSHPRKGETYEIASIRRLKEELGINTKLYYIFQFQYEADFKDKGAENELCSVYIGKTNQRPEINENEIAEWQYIKPEELDNKIQQQPERFTPWFKMEWQRIRSEFWKRVEALLVQ